MTQIECGACHAPTDAPLCRTCTEQLRKTLRALPGLIDDLLTAATGQAVIDDARPAILTQAARREVANLEREAAAVPAALRSRDGRITLPATALPVSLPLMRLHAQAVAGLHDWLDRIGAPVEPVRPVARTEVVIRRNRATAVRTLRRDPTPAERGDWLAAHADQIRQSIAGPEIHAKALDLQATIEATIDRRDPDQFAGVCESVAVDVAWATGVVIATAGKCGTPLLARPGEADVECPKCKTTWDVEERRSAMADKLTDQLGTVREVTGFLRTLELDVTVDKIDGWLRRGRIVDHGSGPTGRLVKVGEVRAYAEAQAERAKARRGVRVSA